MYVKQWHFFAGFAPSRVWWFPWFYLSLYWWQAVLSTFWVNHFMQWSILVKVSSNLKQPSNQARARKQCLEWNFLFVRRPRTKIKFGMKYSHSKASLDLEVKIFVKSICGSGIGPCSVMCSMLWSAPPRGSGSLVYTCAVRCISHGGGCPLGRWRVAIVFLNYISRV